MSVWGGVGLRDLKTIEYMVRWVSQLDGKYANDFYEKGEDAKTKSKKERSNHYKMNVFQNMIRSTQFNSDSSISK